MNYTFKWVNWIVCVLYLNKDVKKKKNGRRKLKVTTKNMDFMTDFSSCYWSELARPCNCSCGINVLNVYITAVKIPSTSPPVPHIPAPQNHLHFSEPARHFHFYLTLLRLCYVFLFLFSLPSLSVRKKKKS